MGVLVNYKLTASSEDVTLVGRIFDEQKHGVVGDLAARWLAEVREQQQAAQKAQAEAVEKHIQARVDERIAAKPAEAGEPIHEPQPQG